MFVSTIISSHDFSDRDARFASVVEWDCRYEVVADVGADNVVEKVGVDEAEVAIDGGCGTTGEGPGAVTVVG